MDVFTLDNLVSLAMLTLLQAVLGFDNLLYISLESKRAPAHRQAYVRQFDSAPGHHYYVRGLESRNLRGRRVRFFFKREKQPSPDDPQKTRAGEALGRWRKTIF